jgi:hypothetical protein
MDTPWLEFQAFLNRDWARGQPAGRIWEITDSLGPSFAPKRTG